VDRVRDTLGEGFRQDFEQRMLTQVSLNPSIYANPEREKDVDTECPFFLTSSVNVAGDPRQRVMLLTTDRVMTA
jgi:hypothetical protein